MTSAAIVQKLLSACGHAQAGWNYCNVLRDDGIYAIWKNPSDTILRTLLKTSLSPVHTGTKN